MFMKFEERQKKENQVRKMMENNIITLRKNHKNEKLIEKIKDNNILSFSLQENNYIISSFSFNVSNNLRELWNSNNEKDISLLLKCLNYENEIESKYLIDKNNLYKFILFHFHLIINKEVENNNNCYDYFKKSFDTNTINKLILILYEYTINTKNDNNKNGNSKCSDSEIIIFNICKILIKLTVISTDFSFLIIQNDINIQLIFYSMIYFKEKNQFISNNLLILFYNLYLDDEDRILKECDKLIPFILECLYDYQKEPRNKIIQTDFLINLMEFLSKLLNEKTFHIFFNHPKINTCISLTINIYQNYYDDNIKESSLKCLLSLLHCVDEKSDLKIDNLISFIKLLLPNLNIELNNPLSVVRILEIISIISFLFEIDEFSSDELIDEINQILISLVFHKEQIEMYYDKIQINYIIDNISILLLNLCLSIKAIEYISRNTTIIKNVLLILYNFSLDLEIVKNLYNFLNEFMDNIDNFILLIMCNFLEIGIIKNIDKYSSNRFYEIILMLLNMTYKSLEFGNINQEQNNENNSKVNFVQFFLEKKGFNEKLNIIISPDFGNMKCSDLAKKIQEDFF